MSYIYIYIYTRWACGYATEKGWTCTLIRVGLLSPRLAALCKRTHENERAKERMCERTTKNERTRERAHANERTNKRTNERTTEQLTKARTNEQTCHTKVMPKSLPGRPWDAPGMIPERRKSSKNRSEALLARSWAILGRSGRSWDVSELSQTRSGRSPDVPGTSPGRHGTLPESPKTSPRRF